MVKNRTNRRNKRTDFEIIKPKDEHGIQYLDSLNKELEDFLETFPKFKNLNIRIVFIGSEGVIDYESANVPEVSGSVKIGDGVSDEEIIICAVRPPLQERRGMSEANHSLSKCGDIRRYTPQGTSQ